MVLGASMITTVVVAACGARTGLPVGESVVVADESADPLLLAADLLIEAEHGTDSAVLLITTSAALADAIDVELELQLATLPAARAEAARAALGPNGGCVFVGDLGEASDVANRWAPEHLQVAVSPQHEPELLGALVNALRPVRPLAPRLYSIASSPTSTIRAADRSASSLWAIATTAPPACSPATSAFASATGTSFVSPAYSLASTWWCSPSGSVCVAS